MRHRTGSSLPSLFVLAALAAVAFAVFSRPARQPEPAGRPLPSPPPRPEPAAAFVRPAAGPEAMRDPPPEWDAADETSDESFPASDPPARY